MGRGICICISEIDIVFSFETWEIHQACPGGRSQPGFGAIWIGRGCATGNSGPILMFWGNFSKKGPGEKGIHVQGFFRKKGTHLANPGKF